MASTPQAARLTEAHRLAQTRLAASVVRQVLAAFPLLDPTDIDGTLDRWLHVTVPAIQGQRAMSARISADYLRGFRALELGTSGFVPVLAGLATTDVVVTSLTVTGPVSLKRAAARKVPLATAVDVAKANVGRAAMRHVLNGGRETIVDTVQKDRRALGWARAASGKTCSFCRMLASRGPVYGEDSVHFEAHDGCNCTAEPVYSLDAEWPAGSREYRRQWDEATAGLSGDKAIAAFRDAI